MKYHQKWRKVREPWTQSIEGMLRVIYGIKLKKLFKIDSAPLNNFPKNRNSDKGVGIEFEIKYPKGTGL